MEDGMNFKRFIGATVALFIFMFFYEWLVNGYLMTGLYQETSNVWRPFSQMQANMILRFVMLFIIAAWVTLFYTQFHRTATLAEGAKFGLLLGVLVGLEAAAWYIWLPVTAELSVSWFATNALEGLIGGLILAAIYRR